MVSNFREMIAALQRWAHALTPAGSEEFNGVAWFSLACYLGFAVIALHYAFKPWAEKVMFTCIGSAAAASLWLHLALLHSPSYVGEGALWRFVSLSRYLPWAVFGLSCVYLIHRICARRR